MEMSQLTISALALESRRLILTRLGEPFTLSVATSHETRFLCRGESWILDELGGARNSFSFSSILRSVVGENFSVSESVDSCPEKVEIHKIY